MKGKCIALSAYIRKREYSKLVKFPPYKTREKEEQFKPKEKTEEKK